jgi:exopolyphosphatase/guanosine-5'-triphosphate,3'-diphosphate pyrophosphatase
VRHTTVTRLGQGLGTSGRLAPEAEERVFAVLADYRAELDRLGAERSVAVLTSAVRDAGNGAEFTRAVGERFGLEARTITGEEEGRLTFRGATAERTGPEPVAVIDVGGGSTEFVVGAGGEVSFFESVQAGVVRQSERFLLHDPAETGETQALAEDVRALFAAALPPEVRDEVAAVVGVAGTATSVAAIELGLDPYDPARVHGFRAPLGIVEEQLARLATMREDERREVVGLHPDRAPTIVAGLIILLEGLRALGVDEFEVSEHDILRGAALAAATV